VGSLLINVQEFTLIIPTKPDIEDDAELVNLFFSEVCAPRTAGNGPANGPNQEGQKWDNLCTACKGDCSSNDQYYDYSGAFRCLVEGRGDVAFVKHTTVLDYSTEGTVDEVFRVWADKKPEDYRLLCPIGGCKLVTEYEDCHLAVAPSHALVTTPELGAGGEDEETGLAIRAAILNATTNSDFIEETTALVQGFLWTEGTTGLIPVEKGIEGYLPEDSLRVFDGKSLFSDYLYLIFERFSFRITGGRVQRSKKHDGHILCGVRRGDSFLQRGTPLRPIARRLSLI